MLIATLASEAQRAHVYARDLLYLENYKLARTSLQATIQVGQDTADVRRRPLNWTRPEARNVYLSGAIPRMLVKHRC